MDPSQDYDVTSALSNILTDLHCDDTWIAEHLTEIEIGLAQRLQEDEGLDNVTGATFRWHFYIDFTTRELRSRRFEDPASYDAVAAKLDWLDELKSDPTRNAEAFEVECQKALAVAVPSGTIGRTRLHSDKGIDLYGSTPLQNGLGSAYILSQVKLQCIEGGTEIRVFYGAAQYLLHTHLRHHLNRTPENLRDFLAQMPMAPAVILVFFAATFSPEAVGECNTVGVRPLDFQWIATQLAHSTTPPG